jgi:hypothetical protein
METWPVEHRVFMYDAFVKSGESVTVWCVGLTSLPPSLSDKERERERERERVTVFVKRQSLSKSLSKDSLCQNLFQRSNVKENFKK